MYCLQCCFFRLEKVLKIRLGLEVWAAIENCFGTYIFVVEATQVEAVNLLFHHESDQHLVDSLIQRNVVERLDHPQQLKRTILTKLEADHSA